MYSAADLFLHSYAASRWPMRQMLVVFLFAPGIVSVFSVRYSLIRPFDTLDVQIASKVWMSLHAGGKCIDTIRSKIK
ncbi:hypothetical protein P350_34030 [Burkholderia cepacia JBK9]|uniref:hypothetical protein n=1 Tax=Burkholderia arboris TaxID=488730 RepID=UPI0004DA0040|nr:hypothetical protein [Burkholderia arboris]ALX16672.1 hypothetical protein P350_34030 [Burkholderia cepacia JBK9]MCA8489477.1 hypothetical protein [Burkholderia arboris]UTV60541.1 hypothetical protein NLX30_35770 [Burkholderia arboris]